jgi:hypothetical protein
MTAPQPGLWRFERGDVAPILWILLLPVLLAAPQWTGWLQADPMLYTGWLSADAGGSILKGVPYLDPNNGFQTQALGRRAALDWLHGQVPWWNYYSGVGLPLAAEYQPGALFPLTLLLLLPKGPVLLQLSLQVLCGIGTYGLLRQLGSARFSATVGALLFAFNGTLAWQAHAPASAVPFLPWFLWAVERTHASTAAGRRPDGVMLALAMAGGLLCAFPETSYIEGLLGLCWATLRGAQLPRELRARYARGIIAGGLVGIAIAAPQVYAFFQFLPHAHIGSHDEFAHLKLPWPAAAQTFVTPYLSGPIFAYVWDKPHGYVTATCVVVAAYGFWVRRDALAWLLAGWMLVTLGKSFGVEPFVWLMNWIPGVGIAMFARYVTPTWQLPLVILAARAIEHLIRNGGGHRQGTLAAAVMAALALGVAAATLAIWWPDLPGPRGLRNAALASIAWAALTMGLAWVLLARASAGARSWLAALLVADAMAMAFIPSLSAPRRGTPDLPALQFLTENIGLQRFYTLGPIQANYGAYFGIASINHNYLPVSRKWVDWIRANLDATADAVAWNGTYRRPKDVPSQADELRSRLPAYQWVGVKYVVARGHDEPLTGVAGVRLAYRDALMSIYELPRPAPYFESLGGHCRITATDRALASVDCAQDDVLVRRELHFPGWTAKAGGRDAPIAEHRGLFQAVALPAGRTEVRFDYAPPHVGWAWLASLLGVLAAGASCFGRARAPLAT